MTRVDQFESVFRAADKAVFAYERVALNDVLVVTDLPAGEAQDFTAQIRTFLAVLGPDRNVVATNGAAFDSVEGLLRLVEQSKPDLVVTYRHLHSDTWQWPHGLGEFVDVLAQVSKVPVLLVPHPVRGAKLEHALTDSDSVLAITDHLCGDDHLVNVGVRLTMASGTLHLAHVESQSHFDRSMSVIAKIPAIDTEDAREAIAMQLLKEPRDYIESVREVLAETSLRCSIDAHVSMGRRLEQYKQLIHDHELDLIVIETADETQSAMGALAYALAVEIRNIPLLLI